MTNTRWRIIALLVAATVISYMDRVNLSYVAPTFMKQFHIGPAEMGLVLSAFLWTYFIVQVPLGLALDRFGLRFIPGAAGVLWGVATILTATATGLNALIGWRVLLGVGEGPMVPTSVKVLGTWIGDQERGFASAVHTAGIPIGVFVASPFIGWLLADFGWRAVFVCTGAFGVIWAGVWLWYYREVGAHAGMSDAERQFLRNNTHRPDMVPLATWRALLSNRNIVGLSIGHATLLFNLYYLISWLPTYLMQQHHLSMLHTGIYGAVPWLFGVLGVLVGGKGSDVLIKRNWPIIKARKVILAGGMLLTMTSLISAFTTSLDSTIACLSISVFGILFTNSVVWAACAEVAPLHQRGLVSTIQNCIGNFGGFLAPMVVGLLLQVTHDWVVPMLAAAIVALAGAATYFFVLSDSALFSQSEAPGRGGAAIIVSSKDPRVA